MMRRHRQQPSERELAALADGSLPAKQRARVERAVADSPELEAMVSAQRRVLAAIDQAADERAPGALRARLELLREPHGKRDPGSDSAPRSRARPESATRSRGAMGPGRPTHSRRATRPRGATRLLPAGALAAAAVAVALVLTLGGGVSAPTVAQAAVLATRPAMSPAPAPAHGSATLAGLKAAGLPYPYWDDRFGFHATGVRRDRLDGRPATTVFYTRGAQRVAYTIVSGRPLPVGAPATGAIHNGVWVRALRAHGMRVVTWLRGDHSCVLAGRDVSFRVLSALASWRGGGRIPY